MAITYPITLPLKPGPRTFTQSETSFAAMSQSPWSGVQQVQLNQGQLWAFSVDYPPMSEDHAREWSGVLAQLNGRFGTFLFGDPRWKSPRGSWAGAPVVNGSGQSGQTLAMNGFTVGATGRAGDYFQHGSGSASRLYKVTQDFVADGAGEAQVEIWPRIRISPTGGDSLTLQSPKGVFRLASPTVARSWEPFRHGLSFEMIEAL
jgi:hypothetical protein